VREHAALYGSASQMVRSPRLRAFDITQERNAVRDRYGRNPFGSGCLLARRLVETGVTFIEVESNGWDTHQDNFERTRSLSENVDKGFAALVTDLRERGLLERTLVIWMGEFGRTPRINQQRGRDHYPNAWTTVLAGGGLNGGQVVGRTSADGTTVEGNGPVSVPDFMATVCRALGIDPTHQNMSNVGRPIRIADAGSRAIRGVVR
jgi:uncharacterized protein (DUF1501 family)